MRIDRFIPNTGTHYIYNNKKNIDEPFVIQQGAEPRMGKIFKSTKNFYDPKEYLLMQGGELDGEIFKLVSHDTSKNGNKNNDIYEYLSLGNGPGINKPTQLILDRNARDISIVAFDSAVTYFEGKYFMFVDEIHCKTGGKENFSLLSCETLKEAKYELHNSRNTGKS